MRDIHIISFKELEKSDRGKETKLPYGTYVLIFSPTDSHLTVSSTANQNLARRWRVRYAVHPT